MAEMRINRETGEVIKWDRQSGGWIPASETETAVATSGLAGTIGAGIEGATGIPGLMNSELGQALSEQHPIASGAALAATLGGGLLPGGIKGAGRLLGRKGMGSMAERVATRSKTGGSMFRTESGLVKRPADMLPEILKPTGRALESGLEAIPGLRIAGDAIKYQRRSKAGQTLQKALGMEPTRDGKMTREVFDRAMTPVDDAYGAARTEVTANITPAQTSKIQKQIEELGTFTDDDLAYFAGKTADDVPAGDKLLELRSELRAMQRTADTERQRRRVSEIIDNIQTVVRDSVSEGTKANLDEADRVYRLWKTIDNSAAINMEGQINYASLNNALRKGYGSRATRGGKGVADESVESLVQILDEIGQLGPTMPTSGTAERTIAAGLVGGALGLSTRD